MSYNLKHVSDIMILAKEYEDKIKEKLIEPEVVLNNEDFLVLLRKLCSAKALLQTFVDAGSACSNTEISELEAIIEVMSYE